MFAKLRVKVSYKEEGLEAINPSAEDPQPSTVDKAFAGLGRVSRFLPREVRIGLLVLVIFGIFLALIVRFREPEDQQGNIYTDQLRIFKEMHSAPRRGEGENP